MATGIHRTLRGHFVVCFDNTAIHTTLTASGRVVDKWLDEIRRKHRRRLDRLVVGIDVEWRPASTTTRHGPGASPPVALLQVCVGRRCLVFQILHAEYLPSSLIAFLADERFCFVGVGVRDDAARLRSGYGLRVGRTVDLRSLAATTLGKPALRAAGLPALVLEVMGVAMEKPHHVRVSAWDARKLTFEQLKYACVDAFASFEVGRRLFDGEY